MVGTVRSWNGEVTEHTFRNKREKSEVSHESDLEKLCACAVVLGRSAGPDCAQAADSKPTPAHQFTYSYLAMTKCCSFRKLT